MNNLTTFLDEIEECAAVAASMTPALTLKLVRLVRTLLNERNKWANLPPNINKEYDRLLDECNAELERIINETI